MSATVLPSAAPPNALHIWSNGRDIFVEIPATDKTKAPYIIRYNLSEGGLSKALSLLRIHADNSGIPITDSKRRSNLSGSKLVGTEAQHDLAQSILRRKGMIR